MSAANTHRSAPGVGTSAATKPRCTTCGAKLGSTKMVGSRCIHCG